jgi:hypothetical protein
LLHSGMVNYTSWCSSWHIGHFIQFIILIKQKTPFLSIVFSFNFISIWWSCLKAQGTRWTF